MAETAAGTIASRPIPIGAAIGDQQSALFGQGAVEPGQAKVTYGTGAFLLMHTGAGIVRSRNRLLSTASLGPAGEPAYALEGAIFVAGAVVQWLRDGLGVIRRAQDTMELALRGGPRSGTYLVPAFVGLGAPYWDSGARGAIVGITRGTSAADLVRAALDSIAYQVCDVFRAMERDGRRPIAEVRADGGAAANDYLMQFQADVLSRPGAARRDARSDCFGCGDAGGTGLRDLALTGGIGPAARVGPRVQAADGAGTSATNCSGDGTTRSTASGAKAPAAGGISGKLTGQMNKVGRASLPAAPRPWRARTPAILICARASKTLGLVVKPAYDRGRRGSGWLDFGNDQSLGTPPDVEANGVANAQQVDSRGSAAERSAHHRDERKFKGYFTSAVGAHQHP